MNPPVIKKVSANGQISLPAKYKNHHVSVRELEGSLRIDLLVWDEDLERWLNVSDPEDKDILAGEVIWGRNTSEESYEKFRDLLRKSIEEDGG